MAKNSDGPLDQEFARLLQEMQIGVGRIEAMRAMAERTSLPDLKSFCLAMVQADSLGIPIARVLRIQSQEMRTKRRQRAEEKAQQVPGTIMIPLVLFILPCLFIVILGPAGIQIADTFSQHVIGDMTSILIIRRRRAAARRSQSWRTTTAVRVFALALATGTLLSAGDDWSTSAPILRACWRLIAAVASRSWSG